MTTSSSESVVGSARSTNGKSRASKRLQFFVDGEWRDTTSGQYMPVTNSGTGEVMAEVPKCTVEEVNAAVEAAAAAFPGWRDTPLSVRVQVMFRFKQLIERDLSELAVLLADEMGKNLNEARGDILKAIEVVELACALPVTMQGDSLMNVAKRYDTVSYREPLGVFVGIVPFNFPAMIPMGWMVPLAITTGNTFVLKAASWSPQTVLRMTELLREAGLPKGVLNTLTCSRHEAEILLTHPAVRGVSFVGSTGTGLHVYRTASAAGKRVQCLTEAKNHAVVLRDAPILPTAARIVNSAFGCAGQRCMALPVVCVEEEIADEFVATLVDLAKNLKVGPGSDPATDVGPLVTEEHRRFVLEGIEKGVAEGAELVLDGRDVSVPGHEDGFFVGPTVFDHVTPEMRVGIDEIFGPVLAVKRIANFEEGLELSNSSEFANGSSIFTLNGHYSRESARRSDGGMVGINVGIPVPISAFPFSGHKSSFFGDLHMMGKDGIAFFTETKTVTTYWFGPEETGESKVGTWEGTITRS